MAPATASPVETYLRDELARENRALGAVVPVLRHLLAGEGQGLVSDAILARVRGMLSDLARQLLALREGSAKDGEARDALAGELAADPALLGLCHALAAESQLAERLLRQRSIDPVLSPLLQELIASDDPPLAELAMNALAAQSRFIQSQGRMELPLGELPAEMFHALMAAHAPAQDSPAAAQAQQEYDEAASRLGLLARLVSAMRRGAVAALALDHAGAALFASGLAVLGRLPREQAVLACHEQQGVRLALALRAAGLEATAIERQFLLAGSSARLPRDLEAVAPGHARLLLGADGAQ